MSSLQLISTPQQKESFVFLRSDASMGCYLKCHYAESAFMVRLNMRETPVRTNPTLLHKGLGAFQVSLIHFAFSFSSRCGIIPFQDEAIGGVEERPWEPAERICPVVKAAPRRCTPREREMIAPRAVCQHCLRPSETEGAAERLGRPLRSLTIFI